MGQTTNAGPHRFGRHVTPISPSQMYDDRESRKTVDPMTIISNIAIPMDSILTITYPIGIVYTACDDHDRRLPMTA